MSHLIRDNLIDSIGPNSKGTILRSMAVFVAMELCGSFLTGKTGPGSTKANFLKFCNSEYMPQPYHRVSSLLYSIFRNGVSHSYVPQGGALLSGAEDAARCHLQFYRQGMCIYVHQFADDVKVAILALHEDIKSDPKLNQNYHSIFEQLDQIGKEEYGKFLSKNKIQVQEGVFTGDIHID